ncbi:ABC-F family ATP-binding cassette domain-containing protein [Alkalicoccus chagannorensis]|uniref:ABC-F family ATP-binding cassette domain-containing protein n=1 Tax=Alkalicoccus chagannorensis TaxID=427072 RepID=UPI000418C762|nr:ABC-F family ATP-binding cassette domain-containing protein [Alkalicoccus chagannorensis]
MSLLRAEQLQKTYGEKTLFHRISFTIEKKERIGIVGVNGTGKSSLLRAIAGLEPAEIGEIIHANDFRLEYVPQEPELPQDAAVLDIVFDGDAPVIQAMKEYERALAALEADAGGTKAQDQFARAQARMDKEDAWEANAQAKTILTKLGVRYFDAEIGTLSGGQRRRVSLAKALIQPADLLMLDEPTNHLDNETVEWLEEYLRGYEGALMMITHDRYFLNRVTNRIYELDDGRLYIYEGNYEQFLEQKALRHQHEEKVEDKRQNILRREVAWLKRGAKARTTKQKARKQRIETMQDQEGPKQTGELDFAIGSRRLGKKVLELEQVGISRGGNTLVEHADLLVQRGDRIGIIGPNGAGKTSLLHAAAGRIDVDSGEVIHGETVHIGYYTQDHEPLDENLRVIDYVKQTAEAVQTSEGAVITAEQMLERFLFPRSHQWTQIRRLSGGERKRLYLLKVLMEEPNVLFLDEPTNDLDTTVLAVLEDYLDQFPGVVITVSHDRYFLDRVVDRLLVLREDSTSVVHFYGSYSEWLEQEKQQAAAPSAAPTKKPEAEKPAQQKKKLSYKEKLEWESIEEDISRLEAAIEALDEEAAGTGSDAGRAADIMKEKEEKEQELESKLERWEELSLLVEELGSH